MGFWEVVGAVVVAHLLMGVVALIFTALVGR